MRNELRPLNEHDLVQFLTGWGINDATKLGKAICQRFHASNTVPLDEDSIGDPFYRRAVMQTSKCGEGDHWLISKKHFNEYKKEISQRFGTPAKDDKVALEFKPVLKFLDEFKKRKETPYLRVGYEVDFILELCAKFSSPAVNEVEINKKLLDAAKEWVQWFDYLSAYQHENLVSGQTLESASENWGNMVDPSPPIDKLRKAIEDCKLNQSKSQGGGMRAI